MENHQTRNPPDIVTYRLNGKMVYVTPADNYEQALDFAQKVFRQQLGRIKRDRISFAVTVITNGERRSVRIAEMAWGAVVATLQRYEIIDVHVQPEVHIIDSDVRVSYIDDEGDGESKEATEFFSREARDMPRSCPTSKAPSRKSSPSARSLNSIDKGAKRWLEKHVHFS
jgi:hypothetical protein